VSDEDDKFLSLATLYCNSRVSAGALADAIEREGVWGWDRFDRFRHFKEGHREREEALDRLARQVAADTDPRVEKPDLDPLYDTFFFYGWMARQRPDFAKLGESQQLAKPRPSDAAKIEKSDLGIIGALLYAVEGKANCSRHPDFPTAERLIAHLAENMRGYRGLSKRTLETRFAEARALIDKPE
jgi:hypothetical protein